MSLELHDMVTAPPLGLSYLMGTDETLVVSLAGVGKKRDEQPLPEFFKLASQGGKHHVLFVSDASRSWLNGPGLADRIVSAIERTAAETKASRIVAVGNSMGGTMALLLAGLTRIDIVLAVVPQFSAHPNRVPGERRWRFFRNQITEWPFEAVDELPPENTQSIILHGGTADECRHLDQFPTGPNARHFVFPDMDHNLAHRLLRRKQLGAIVRRAIAGENWRMRRAIEKAGGVSRAQFDASR